MDVIGDPSFEEVELSTIITILDQDALNVDNELALFLHLIVLLKSRDYAMITQKILIRTRMKNRNKMKSLNR